MRTREMTTFPTYPIGLRRARGVFRQFKATRYAFAEAVALDYLKELKAGGTYTATRMVNGELQTFDLLDFLPSMPAHLQGVVQPTATLRITLPYAATAEADEAFLIEVQADIDSRRARGDSAAITTYHMNPHALVAAALRMKAAVMTAHWKRPVGLKVASYYRRHPKTVPRRPVYS